MTIMNKKKMEIKNKITTTTLGIHPTNHTRQLDLNGTLFRHFSVVLLLLLFLPSNGNVLKP